MIFQLGIFLGLMWGQTYTFFIPPTATPSLPAPLIIVLHGTGGEGTNLAKKTGFTKVALQNGFAVVYANSLGKEWDDGSIPAEDDPTDMNFIDTLLDQFQRNPRIDSTRAFAVGFSNGGTFAYRLACERADRFLGIVAVAALMPDRVGSTCKPSRPVSVLQIMGTEDPILPFDGGKERWVIGQEAGSYWSASRTIDFWLNANRCEPYFHFEELGADGNSSTSVEIRNYQRCASSASVVNEVVIHGGHHWPGSHSRPSIFNYFLGRKTHLIDASVEAVKFLSELH